MTTDPALPPGFAELWQDFIDGVLDAEHAEALDQLLRSDPVCASFAAERYVDHRLLTLALQREPDHRFGASTLARLADERQSFSRRVQQRLTPLESTPIPVATWDFVRPTIYGVAAMLSVAVLAAILSWRSASTANQSNAIAPTTNEAPIQVATLVLADRCVWTNPHQVAGQRLTTGELELTAGTALVHFDGGADMLLTGPVAVRLESGGSAWCGHGTVTVRAAQHAAGFIVRTPVAQITDLGTEFCLTIAPTGATDVQVLDGGVEWRNNAAAASDPGAILNQGQALRVRSSEDRTGDSMPLTAVPLEVQLTHLSAPKQLNQQTSHTQISAPQAPPQSESASESDDLISYDHFAYPFTRTTSIRHEATGGHGWRSAWYRSQQNNELPIDIAHDSLSMPDHLLPGQGGSLELPSEPERPGTYREACMRLFAEPIHLAQNDVRYVSLLVRRSPSVAGPTHYWFRCMLTSETVPDDRLGFGLTSTGCPQLMSHFGNSQSYVPIVDGLPYLFVFKLVASHNAPAQSFLMVYGQHDPVDGHEPSTWTVVGVPGRFAGVLGSIHINNGTERAYTVDELRIGTTWQAVTPRR